MFLYSMSLITPATADPVARPSANTQQTITVIYINGPTRMFANLESAVFDRPKLIAQSINANIIENGRLRHEW